MPVPISGMLECDLGMQTPPETLNGAADVLSRNSITSWYQVPGPPDGSLAMPGPGNTRLDTIAFIAGFQLSGKVRVCGIGPSSQSYILPD